MSIDCKLLSRTYLFSDATHGNGFYTRSIRIIFNNFSAQTALYASNCQSQSQPQLRGHQKPNTSMEDDLQGDIIY